MKLEMLIKIFLGRGHHLKNLKHGELPFRFSVVSFSWVLVTQAGGKRPGAAGRAKLRVREIF